MENPVTEPTKDPTLHVVSVNVYGDCEKVTPVVPVPVQLTVIVTGTELLWPVVET